MPIERRPLSENGRSTAKPFYRFYAIAQPSREMSLPNAMQDPTTGCGSTTEPGSRAISLHLAGDIERGKRRVLKIAIHAIKRHSWRWDKWHVRNLQDLIGQCDSRGPDCFRQSARWPLFQVEEEIGILQR